MHILQFRQLQFLKKEDKLVFSHTHAVSVSSIKGCFKKMNNCLNGFGTVEKKDGYHLRLTNKQIVLRVLIVVLLVLIAVCPQGIRRITNDGLNLRNCIVTILVQLVVFILK